MLRFEMTDADGNRILMPAVLSLTIRMEEDVPADDLYAVFPEVACGELCGITVYDADRVVFTGVVDEEEHLADASGSYLRLSARSLAAHLLDNEAPPKSYDHPSARLIYQRHVKDYGIAAGDLDDATCLGELNIVKGMSQWGAVSAFCGACYSSSPRVTADGVLYLKGTPAAGEAVFGDGGIRYVERADCRRRCEEISRVNVKISAAEGYDHAVENDDALRRGIRRERYLNAMLDAKAFRTADRMLNKSREKARTLSLKCPGRHLELLGRSAVLRDRTIADGETFTVSAVKYRMSKNGEYTIVTLKRRIGSCGYPDM